MDNILERISWKQNENAVELGFEFYLDLLEKRIKGQNISLVQSLRNFFADELGIKIRETQARGLMHKSSSVFIEYVKAVSGESFNPASGYWKLQGLGKFLEWRKKWDAIRKQEAVDLQDQPKLSPAEGKKSKILSRKTVTVNRIIRDNALSRFLKATYDSHCQICLFTFMVPGGRKYAETHHIQPLGEPHYGMDHENNIIVLCPLHHAMFDYGVIALHPEKLTIMCIDNTIKGIGEPLQLKKHPLAQKSLEYHLENIYGKVNYQR